MTNILGAFGEQAVATYLKKIGFVILEQNYKKFFGEIDIIARNADLIVFVEVKTRKNSKYPMGNLITRSKQHKIILTAQSYIAQLNVDDVTYRFDVALLHILDNGQQELRYIPHAFYQIEE